MRTAFAEGKLLGAADLEDERGYLDDAYARHLALVHGTDGSVLRAGTVAHPDERTAIGFAGGPAGTALTVRVAAAGGAPSEQVRVTEPAAQAAVSQLVFTRPAAAAASAAAPGTLSLLEGVGNPTANELRIETPGAAGSGPVLECGYGANSLLIEAPADTTVVAGDLTVTGKLAIGPAPAPAAPAAPDPTGSVAAAEALRQQLAQGLGIGADVGIAIAIANPVVGGGRVGFAVEVSDVQGVAPLSIRIRGRVNVGTAAVADVAPPSVQLGQIPALAVDVPVPAGVTGDVIVAVTAYGVHPQVGLVNASEARVLGTVV